MKSCWKVVYNSFRPVEEGLREALCTLGNGYFGTRGAATESAASRKSYPGTYIAGVYNKLVTNLAGQSVTNEDLVNCPNWLFLTFRMGRGSWAVPSTARITAYRQELDLRHGVLSRDICFKDDRGQRATVKTQRIVHMGNPHRAAISYTITPENYEGWLTISSGLDGSVENKAVLTQNCH